MASLERTVWNPWKGNQHISSVVRMAPASGEAILAKKSEVHYGSNTSLPSLQLSGSIRSRCVRRLWCGMISCLVWTLYKGRRDRVVRQDTNKRKQGMKY